jgi:sugar phosphate isomerase/epimerase
VAIGSWAFSFGPYESAPWTFDRFVDFARDNGYDGVEINGFRPHPHDEDYSAGEAARMAGQVRDAGLGIAGFAPDLRSTPPAEVDTEQYLSRIRSIAAFCDAAQIDRVRVDTITPAEGPRVGTTSDAYGRLVRTFRAAAAELEEHDIGLIWESEPGFWLNRPSEVVRLLQDVDHPNFGFLFDSSHAHTSAAHGRRQGEHPEILEGGAVEFAALVAPWVHHLHLIDSDGSLHDEETSVHMPFGLGEIDFPALLDALGPEIAGLPWWTVDYCFWPTAHVDATTGAATVRAMRDAFIDRLGSGH